MDIAEHLVAVDQGCRHVIFALAAFGHRALHLAPGELWRRRTCHDCLLDVQQFDLFHALLDQSAQKLLQLRGIRFPGELFETHGGRVREIVNALFDFIDQGLLCQVGEHDGAGEGQHQERQHHDHQLRRQPEPVKEAVVE